MKIMRLAPHDVSRGEARRLVERHPPRGQGLAEAAPSARARRPRAAASRRPAGRRRATASIALALERRRESSSSTSRRSTSSLRAGGRPARGPPRRGPEHRGQDTRARPPRLAPAAALPEALRDLGAERRRGPPRPRPPADRVEHAPLAIEDVDARRRARAAPQLDRLGTEVRRRARRSAGREALLLGPEDRHLDLLGRHRRHVARLLAQKQLRGRLPLAKRDVAERRPGRAAAAKTAPKIRRPRRPRAHSRLGSARSSLDQAAPYLRVGALADVGDSGRRPCGPR